MATKRPDGLGTVQQIHVKDCARPKDGRGNSACKCKWRGVLVVGHKTNPKPGGLPLPIRKTVTRASRTGAANALLELRTEHQSRNLPAGKVPTLEQWLNVWHAKHLRKVRPRTVDIYRQVVDAYLIPTMGHIRLDRITSEDIEAAWDLLRDDGNPTLANPRPLSDATIHHAHTVLRRALRVAVQRKHLTINPASPDAMDAPPAGKGQVEAIATEHWRAIRDQAATGEHAARWALALSWGLRQGEVLGLRWEDVDLVAGVVKVRQIQTVRPGVGLVYGPPKTKASIRDIALDADTVQLLKARRRTQNEQRLTAGSYWTNTGLVFTMPDGKALSSWTDHDRWTRLLQSAGVPHYRLHAARHTAATIMLVEGIDSRVVMQIMGWSQIATAANYQHAIDEAKQAAALRIGRAYGAS